MFSPQGLKQTMVSAKNKVKDAIPDAIKDNEMTRAIKQTTREIGRELGIPQKNTPIWDTSYPSLTTNSDDEDDINGYSTPAPRTPGTPNTPGGGVRSWHTPSAAEESAAAAAAAAGGRAVMVDTHNLLSVVHNPRGDTSVLGIMKGGLSEIGLGWGEDQSEELNEDGQPATQRELPIYLRGLDVSSVQAFLGDTGHLAKKLARRLDPLKVIDELHDSDDDGPDLSKGFDFHHTRTTGNEHGPMTDTPEPTVKAFGDIESCRRIVPERFFDPNFTLADPVIFEELLITDAIASSSPTKSPNVSSRPGGNNHHDGSDEETGVNGTPKAKQQPTQYVDHEDHQETLTQYLDLVEVALLKQIRSKSADFFREFINFQDLAKVVQKGCDEVVVVRRHLQVLKKRHVTDVEDIPVQHRKKENLAKVMELMVHIQTITSIKASIPALVQGSEFSEALKQIHNAKDLIEEHGLRKLTCLKKVTRQLDDLEAKVGERIGEQFVEKMLDYDMQLVDYNCETLLPLTVVLERREANFQKATDNYAMRLLEKVKLTVKHTVSESCADVVRQYTAQKGHANEKMTTTAALAAMSFPQFMSCLSLLFEQVLTVLTQAARAQAFLAANSIQLPIPTPGTAGNPSGVPGEEYTTWRPSALVVACDLAHESVANLLKHRKESNSQLSVPEMKHFWEVCLAFTLELETHTPGKKALALRNGLYSQAQTFIQAKHVGHMSNLATTLDGEKWTEFDVSPQRQQAIDDLAAGKAVLSKSNRGAAANHAGDGAQQSQAAEGVPEAGQAVRDVLLEGSKYKVVWSCLSLLEMLLADLAMAAHFQQLAPELVRTICELLRLINARSRALVLEQGALHSAAHLKGVSSKHLALTSQCLGLVGALLPHVRAALMAQMGRKQHGLLGDVDKIKTELKEHNETILNKFTSIVAALVEEKLAPSINAEDFDKRAKSDAARGQICPFIDGVTKNCAKLHSVLCTVLPSDQLHSVFSMIFNYLDHKIPELFLAVHMNSTKANMLNPASKEFKFPTTPEGQTRLCSELKDLATKLGRLIGDEEGLGFQMHEKYAEKWGITLD